MALINPSKFWLGGNIFGYSAQEDAAIEILDNAAKKGINGIDTSSTYSDGVSETIIGRWLNHDKVRRQRFHVSTKVGLNSYENPIGLGKPSRIVETLHSSLQRLQTDYVDVLFLHAPDPETDISVTVEAFHELQQNGLIKGFGICNASLTDVQKYLLIINSIGISQEHFYIQNYFNWARRKHDYWNDFSNAGHPNSINSVSYGLLARGAFMPESGINDRFSRKNMNSKIMAEITDPSLKSKFQFIESLCRDKGQTLYSYALAYGYYLSNYSIIGVRTLNQLGELIEVSDNLMSQNDFDEIREGIEASNLEFSDGLGDPLIFL
jgi:aryl-alcohol dehydrogenase-like predicted oxidoreductase